ncbi:MAG: hypothetical protein BGO31_00335 [Bacteroidetes bacterium 43-16]|nr:hypothetical protein [uncultured Flavobacterium sp.]OJV51696.1 MAG: hypothetical protein BGO31_00335 [Bacteroidetes bacterium 43-16]
MNNGTKDNIRNNRIADRKKTTGLASTTRKIRRMDEKTKRCKRSTAGQTAVRTSSDATNAFLNCTFLPKLNTKDAVHLNKGKTERDFYKSLSKVERHYNISAMPIKNFSYPYNIALSMWDMQAKVRRSLACWADFKLLQHSSNTYIAIEEKCNIDTILYYVPIIPLYKLLKDPERKKSAQLLLSVCSYLYHIADIPYYRQDQSYLAWMYEIHKEWVEQEEEEELTKSYLQEFDKADWIGDRMEQKIFNRINLDLLHLRIEKFNGLNKFDNACKKVAENALSLYTLYPKESIFRNASVEDEDTNEDYYENESIGMDKYISFISDISGWLPDSIIEQLNNEFNEYGRMQEPVILKNFDGRKIPADNLNFECKLFTLLEDLTYLLHNHKIFGR